jgi:hypothetical protein
LDPVNWSKKVMFYAFLIRNAVCLVVVMLVMTLSPLSGQAYEAKETGGIPFSPVSVVKDLHEGFLDNPWGTGPQELQAARRVVDIAGGLAVYSANLDVSLAIGAVQPYSNPLLIFSKEEGLVLGHIDFSPRNISLLNSILPGC